MKERDDIIAVLRIIGATESNWLAEELRISTEPTLVFENMTSSEQLFVFETTVWSDQAVTAAEVTTLQVFRDLFAREALRPDERISVGSLAIMFTDLRESTRLYRKRAMQPHSVACSIIIRFCAMRLGVKMARSSKP